jgi:Zn-dependent metalloprotease
MLKLGIDFTKGMYMKNNCLYIICFGLIIYPQLIFSESRGKKIEISKNNSIEKEIEDIENRKLKVKDSQLKIKDVGHEDLFGTKQIRMQQYYKGIPVEGAELIRRIVKGDTLLDQSKGRIFDNIYVADVIPKIEKERAIKISSEYYYSNKLGRGTIVLKGIPELVIFHNQLAYALYFQENEPDHFTWKFLINAVDGSVIFGGEHQVYHATPPSNSGTSEDVQGIRLSSEGGGNVTMTGWRDTYAPQNYFLYYKGGTWGSWGIYNESSQDWVKNATNNWLSTDQFSISAAKNIELSQKWLYDFLGYNSYNNLGALAEVHTNVASAEGPYFSDGKIYLSSPFADGTIQYQQGGALDVVAHEFGHGITLSAYGPGSDPYYYQEPGVWDCRGTSFYFTRPTQLAQNESYSDIIGFAVEYASQPDNLANYPSTTPGTADWLIGEDFISPPYKALRDFRYPQRSNKSEIPYNSCTYYLGSNYLIDFQDEFYSCWVWFKRPRDSHDLCNIQNFAFYLLSQGSSTPGTNDGHNYDAFAGVGIDVALKIVLDACMNRLNPWSTFQDARNEWYNAAEYLELHGLAPSNACEAVNAAWKAVGVEPELRMSLSDVPALQFGAQNGDLLSHQLCYPMDQLPPAGSGGLKIYNTSTGKGIGIYQNTGLFGSGMPSIDQAAVLDNAGSLTGKLIIRAPNGKVQFASDPSTGNWLIRGKGVHFGI